MFCYLLFLIKFFRDMVLQTGWFFNEEARYFSIVRVQRGSAWCLPCCWGTRAGTGPLRQTLEVCRLLG